MNNPTQHTPAASGPRALPPVLPPATKAGKAPKLPKEPKPLPLGKTMAQVLAEKEAKTKAAKAKGAKAPKVAKEPKAKKPAAPKRPKSVGGAGKEPRRAELNPATLDAAKAQHRLKTIYAKQGRVERAKAAYEEAKVSARLSKADFEEALTDLEKEVHEQRFGPGPLWNADGTGPAGKPGVDAAEGDEG